jgi:hypothetical protein
VPRPNHPASSAIDVSNKLLRPNNQADLPMKRIWNARCLAEFYLERTALGRQVHDTTTTSKQRPRARRLRRPTPQSGCGDLLWNVYLQRRPACRSWRSR